MAGGRTGIIFGAAAVTAALAGLLVTACRPVPTAAPVTALPRPPLPSAAFPAPPPTVEVLASTLEQYKQMVAERIVAANQARVFSGRLPPMLPAIVVLDIDIGRDGQLHGVTVHRSRNRQASQVALDAVAQAAPYPGAARLLRAGQHKLSFSETFLFNADYRFQLRTLAGPQ